MIGLSGAENWAPPALSPKALRNGSKSVRTAAAVALHAQVDSLLNGLEMAVVGVLAATVDKTAVDVESGFGLAEDLGQALLLGLVEDARRLLSKQAEQLIGEAAKGVALAAERQGLPGLPTTAIRPKDIKGQLLQVMQALRQVLGANLDKKIGGRLRKLGSSLLDQHHDGVTQLGKLREKATEMEKKIKQKLAGSDMAGKGGIAKYLPAGGLGVQLCKHRIKAALSGITSYSKAGYCQQLCRVVTTSRDQLTTHENELASVSLHRPTACVLIVC
jgi:hypothetical protein